MFFPGEPRAGPAKMKLIIALPNPGSPGAPQGMFYPDTDEGEALAKKWMKDHDRPGWGVFGCMLLFSADHANEETFNEILDKNGVKR
jgi:hypothetical protein